MNKILVSLCMIAIVAAIGIGATVAYFSDTETSTGNTISAGTLDLSVNGENPVSSHFELSDVKPGYDESYDVTFKNDGTIDAAHLYLSVASLVETEGVNPEPETNKDEPGDLSPVVDIVVSEGSTILWSGTLKALSLLSDPIDLGGVASGVSRIITLTASINSSVGNDIMGDIATFDIVAQLSQN